MLFAKWILKDTGTLLGSEVGVMERKVPCKEHGEEELRIVINKEV